MGRSMHKRAERQKMLNELQGMAGQAAHLPNPEAQAAQKAAMADGASLQIGGQVFAEVAAEILLTALAGEEENPFPAGDLVEAAKLSRMAGKIYLAANGMEVPGIELRPMGDTEEGTDLEDPSGVEAAEKPEIVEDDEPAHSDIIAFP